MRPWPINPVLSIIFASWLTTAVHAQATDVAAPTLEQRLERLSERIEQRREDLHIPGLALAVVKDDAVILSRGFGVMNVETGAAVTDQTLFAIGSTTKAFTSALMGMLVDEGRLDWDDAVTKHLPYFDLAIRDAEADVYVTLRDLLCHRTGFTRMSLLWAGGTAEREFVLRTAVQAEPYAGFRGGFHYNNVMYMAAGEATGAAADSDWDTLIRERIFKPLGMTSSNTSVTQSQTDPRLALGYLWDEDSESFEHQPMRVLDVIAPAGAINSNVRDMAQWVRFQLGRGEFQGKRLLDEQTHNETWNSHVTLGPGIEYGLGWMLHDWKGRRVVEHGGNIDGFAAEVALLPEEHLGFVLLANVSATPLQAESQSIVWESMLEDWSAEPEAGGMDFDDYLGEYIANFATFNNDTFTVQVQNKNLAVDVPGQMIYELKPPDDEGKWAFAISDQIKVSFERDDDGRVTLMRMHQAGLDFEIPRKGVEIEPEIDLDLLKPYLGKYHFAEQDHDVEAVIQSNRLALDVPGQMVFELRPPDDEGFRTFRILPQAAARFDEAEGRVVSLTLRQAGQTFHLPRVADAEGEAEVEAALPTVDEIMVKFHQATHAERLDQITSLDLTGRMRFANQGVDGTFRQVVDAGGRFASMIDLGGFGHINMATDGKQGWTESSFSPFDELSGKELTELRLQHPFSLMGDWRDVFDEIVVVERTTEEDGVERVVVKGTLADLPPVRLHVNVETGLIDRVNGSTVIKGVGALPVQVRMEDYRSVAGVLLPFRSITENDANGRAVIQFEKAQVNPDLPDDVFRLTPPVDGRR